MSPATISTVAKWALAPGQACLRRARRGAAGASRPPTAGDGRGRMPATPRRGLAWPGARSARFCVRSTSSGSNLSGDGAGYADDDALKSLAGWDSAYRSQTEQLARNLLTMQAVKSALHLFGESNRQMHLFLHYYVSENPLKLTSDLDEWLARLASAPLTHVQEARRSQAAGPRAHHARSHEVSPRECAQWIIDIRAHLANELSEDLHTNLAKRSEGVMRSALERMLLTMPPPDATLDN
mmetsp:Transcript_11734/g.42866  ORF Transcript_11734/g.42866 Transcript_11734/m.42866 type:complete len:239 (+) Transcript_11734:169-885(+)